MSKTTKPKNKKAYQIKLLMNNEVSDVSTDNIAEFIQSVKPLKVTTKVVFSVTKGDKTVTKSMFAPQARRVFFNKLNSEIFTKTILGSF